MAGVPRGTTGVSAFMPPASHCIHLQDIYVGNLAWAISDADLKAEFQKFGPVTKCNVHMDRMTGRSRGFGFVSFEDETAAETAIKEMDGAEVFGRSLRVNASARPAR